MSFQASDLSFNDYVSSPEYPDGDPRVSGDFDDTPLNRHDPEQMLYFINACYRLWDWPPYTKGQGRKLETLVRAFLPAALESQKDIFEWIRTNWRHYWGRC